MNAKVRNCWSLVVLVIVVAGLLGAACTETPTATPTLSVAATPTQSKPSPTPLAVATPTIGPTPTMATPVSTIVLKYADVSPLGGVRTETMDWWGKEIEKRTAGAVKINFFWAGSLVGGTETLDAIKSGLADMGSVMGIYHPAKTPMLALMGYPFGQGEDVAVYHAALRDFYENAPYIKDELKQWNQKPLMATSSGAYGFLLVKPWKTLDELKGKKVMSFGYYSDILQAANVTALGTSAAEAYEAMQRGTADGRICGVETAFRYHWNEVAANLLLAELGIPTQNPSINLGVWNRLPADIQKIFDEVGREASERMAQGYVDQESQMIAQMRAQPAGFSVYAMSEQDRQTLKSLAIQMREKVVADMEAKGLPARAMDKAYQAAYGRALAAKK